MAELTPEDGGLRLHLEAEEAEVLRTLALGLAARLSSDGSASSRGGIDRTSDPVRDRLMPPVSHGHPEVDQELRGMLGHLLDDRVVRLTDLADGLAPEERAVGSRAPIERLLDRPDADRMLQALNDLRLGLGASIGIEASEREDLLADESSRQTLRLMEALAWIQELLIGFLDAPSE